MSPKKKVVLIHFTISLVLIIAFVSVGIYVKDNILKDSINFGGSETEETTEEPIEQEKDVSRDLGVAIFKLMLILAILLSTIFFVYKATTQIRRGD